MSNAVKDASVALPKKASVPEGLAISEGVYALSRLIKDQMKIGEGGVVDVPKDIFETTLPDGLTMADVKRVQDHTSAVVSATGLALGELGQSHFKKNKTVDQLSVEFGIGKDKLGEAYQRERVVSDGKGGQQIKYGNLVAKYTVNGAGNKGTFKKVRDFLSDQAAAVAKG